MIIYVPVKAVYSEVTEGFTKHSLWSNPEARRAYLDNELIPGEYPRQALTFPDKTGRVIIAKGTPFKVSTIEAILPPTGFSNWGAPMGRKNTAPEDLGEVIRQRLYRRRVPFMDTCYDTGGAYWGSGPLYAFYTKDLCLILFSRDKGAWLTYGRIVSGVRKIIKRIFSKNEETKYTFEGFPLTVLSQEVTRKLLSIEWRGEEHFSQIRWEICSRLILRGSPDDQEDEVQEILDNAVYYLNLKSKGGLDAV